MPFRIDYADPATTAPQGGRGLSGWLDWLKGGLPEKISPEERQRRAAVILDVQALGNLVPGYDAALDRIEAARGPAATIEPRRMLAQMQTALATAASPINDGIRAAIEAGRITDTGQLRAFPLLLVLLAIGAALIVAEFVALKQWPGIIAAKEDARQRSALFQAWIDKYNQAQADGTTPPAPPFDLPKPIEPVPWGSFGLAAVLIGAGLLIAGARKR